MGAHQALNLENESVWYDTDTICADCGISFAYTEEIVRVQIVQPHLHNGAVLLLPVIDEEDDDFSYEPYHFHFTCWENFVYELKKQLEDVPPTEDPHSTLHCDMCGSGIREWEFSGGIEMGELHRSRRAPNDTHGPVFQRNGTPSLFCLYCMYTINDCFIELWDNVGPNGECANCLEERCWRSGACDCDCHSTEHEEE